MDDASNDGGSSASDAEFVNSAANQRKSPQPNAMHPVEDASATTGKARGSFTDPVPDLDGRAGSNQNARAPNGVQNSQVGYQRRILTSSSPVPELQNAGVRQKPKKQYYAALDLGTNNCRLLIAEPSRSGFRVVDSFSRIIRLGQGIAHNNRLSDDATQRAIEALRICRNKLIYHQVVRIRLIATEACRAAENGMEFLARIKEEVGLDLEIADRETETRLAVTGCSALVEPKSDGVVLFDIGGGSSEIAWLDRRGRRKRNRLGGTVRAWASLPVGVVTLSERYDGKNVTRESFEEMVDEVRGLLKEFPKREHLEQALSRGRVHLLGTSGTVTTLAGIRLGLKRYDRNKVDGTWMSGEETVQVINDLLALDYEGRMAHPCIGRERADLVLPGCAIFEAIRREFPCDQVRIADRGLREGMLVELMQEDGHKDMRVAKNSGPWRHHRPRSKKIRKEATL